MRRLLFAGGTVMVVWGGYGLMTAARHPRPVPWLTFFVGSALGHDLLLAPVVVTIGAVAVRLVPPRIRPYVTSGLIVTGVVTLIAYPLLRGYGRRHDNPSIQPLDYTRGLLIVLAAAWLAVAVGAAVGLLRRRGRDIAGTS